MLLATLAPRRPATNRLILEDSPILSIDPPLLGAQRPGAAPGLTRSYYTPEKFTRRSAVSPLVGYMRPGTTYGEHTIYAHALLTI